MKDCNSGRYALADILAKYMDGAEEIDALTDALDRMPASRESALEVIEAIESYDIPELYEALFSRFESFLTEPEAHRIWDRCTKTFEKELIRAMFGTTDYDQFTE